jgi:hypothetical protein
MEGNARPADDWLTSDQLAEWLHTPGSTVRYWRATGTGPVGTKVGKRVLYARAAVVEWMAQLAKLEAEEAEARTATA